MTYDLMILGGGPAGYLAAERAAAKGLKVILFEARSLGGVCLNEGCIPSKSLLYAAKTYSHALHGEAYGIKADQIEIDHAKVIARKRSVVKNLVAGVGAKMKKSKVTVIKEKAEISGKVAAGYEIKTTSESYEGKKILICTGSTAIIPPIPGLQEGLEKGYIMTNREILESTELPKHLVIVGGGVIGLEMASYFNAVGVEVTVIEMLDKIAGPMDSEISAMLQNIYTQKGIKFLLQCKVERVEAGKVFYEDKGEKKVIKADRVLLSIGRRPATEGIGLENVGVYVEKGAIVTDEHMKTNVPNIYAAGDVNGKSMLAHTAYREAEVAVNQIVGQKDVMQYTFIPAIIYTDPEAASVGETEATAKNKGLEIEVSKISMLYSGRFLAENDKTDGLCKVILEKGSQRVLGVHLLGSYASEIILSAGVMAESHWPLESLKKIVFPHPTVGEIIKEAFFEI